MVSSVCLVFITLMGGLNDSLDPKGDLMILLYKSSLRTHPDEIGHQRKLKVPVQLDDVITDDVFQAAATAVLPDKSRTQLIHVAANERIHIFMPQIPQLIFKTEGKLISGKPDKSAEWNCAIVTI